MKEPFLFNVLATMKPNEVGSCTLSIRIPYYSLADKVVKFQDKEAFYYVDWEIEEIKNAVEVVVCTE